ncbi:hypothetical protein NDGK_02517 [Clostridiales bacterium CHKCI001]|nr:hypothetical protein NDGK_02517 [Clostridiales bacterium CHKCI001]
MIQLYKIENEDFQHNGDHILFPTKCELDINLNGSWILDIEVPINYEVAEDWNSGAIVSVPTPYGTQLFRLENIDKTDYYLTGSAYPVFLDAGNEVFLEDVRPTGKTGQEALNIMLSGSKFAAESNITTANTAYYVRKNFLEALSGDDDQAFLNRWGGEVLYDNFKIKVYDRVGGDYGFRAEFGKNINGISIKIDNSELITRIYPIAYNGVMLSTDKKYIDSPRIGNYPVVYTSLQKFESLKLETDAQSSEEGYTQEELNLTLRKEVQRLFDSGVDIPKMTVEIDIISLSETPEYKEFKFSEDVKLGDTVTCTYDPYNLEFQARTIRVLYDCILERNLSITIGSYKYDYFTQLDKDHNKIENTIRPDGSLMAEKVQGILNGIYTQLRLQSTVAEKVEGRAFVVEDTDPESVLYGCMVWGTQGLQIAVQRTADGRDWDFTTAITAKGIVANAIITGILSDKLGRNYWNLDTGEFRLSGDAFKVDEQTVQDYVDGKIDDKIAKIRTLTMQLSNEFQGIATDSEGSNGDYTECYTDVKVFIGTIDITNSEAVEYDISPSIGITGSWNDVLKRYKVDYLATDNGYVEIVAFYANLAISKRFSISKTKQGSTGLPGQDGVDGKTSYLHIKYSDDGGINFTSNNGETPGKYIGQYVDFTQADSTDVNSYTWSLAKGADGRSYMLQADTLVIKQGADDVYSPKSVTFTAFYRDGTSAERTNYSGRFIVSETTDGTNYVQKYKSSSNEHSHIHTPTSNNVKNIRCILYAAGGTTQTLDMQGVAIVRDVDNLTQSEVFNILTNNGKLQGIFMKDGQLYINGTYIAVSDWSELSKTLSGFKLSTKRIYGQSEDYCNGMSTGVDNIYAFWAGETNEKLGSGNTDAPYKVSRNGTVWAKRLYAGNVFDFYDDTATWKGDLLNIFREDGILKIKQNHHTNGKTILMLDQAGGEAQLVFNYAGSPHGTVYFYSGYNSSTYVGMYHKERNNGAGGAIWRYHTDGKFHIDASTVANAIECTTLTQTSTEKAKKDIRVTNPDEALQIIKNSRVFNYTLKGFEDLGEQTGLIIERDCPEEIVTPDGTAINLYSYVSIVCNALKALSKQVDFCTNKIDILSKMRKDRGGYSMYEIIKFTIESRNFVVSDIKNKVDTLWIEGVLTSEQREELIQLISEYANPDTQAPELESLIAIVLQEIETIKDRIEKLEGGNETGTEQPNIIPEWKAWDGVSSEYQPGAVVTHNGKYYQNALDIQNTWEPGGEGIDERFWKEITKEEAEKLINE